MIDEDKLRDVVRSNIETLCRNFFPSGKKDGPEWKIGDTSGAPGKSLGIQLTGPNASLCNDRAAGYGGDFIDLLQENRSITYPEAADQIGRFLGVDLEDHQHQGKDSRNGDSIEWTKCNKLSQKQQKRLASWRGYSPELVSWLSEHDLIRTNGANGNTRWIFPVHIDGKVAGTHSRPVEWTGPERCPWLILPKKEKGGPGVRPLTIGDLASTKTVHVFESQWDMFAVCDRLALHLTDGIAAICTRGAQNAKLASILPNTVREVFLWEQNDRAGKTWSDAVVRVLPTGTKAKVVYTPDQHEDPNDWTIKGNATAQQLVEAISAAVPLGLPADLHGSLEVMAQAPKTVPPRPLKGRLLSEYVGKPINHEDTLLGDRYLCRGGGMFVVAPSGVGKSVFSIQCAVNWSVDRPAFGIKPARPHRIMIVQAEDDEGDVIEMSNLATTLNLNEQETALFNANVWMEHVNDLTGEDFTRALDGFLEQWPADIVIINPYSSYLGADVKDDGHANVFLRNWLNPVLTKHRCAALFIHHTPKTQFQNTDDWKPSDWMYRGAGAAALTNWARAYLVIDPTTIHGCYKFIAAKRGRRIGWNGAFHLHFSHSKNDGELLWVPSSQDEIMASASNSKLTAKDLLPFIPTEDEGPKSIPEVVKAAKGTLGEKYVRKFIKELVDLDKIVCHHLKNEQNKSIEKYAQK